MGQAASSRLQPKVDARPEKQESASGPSATTEAVGAPSEGPTTIKKPFNAILRARIWTKSLMLRDPRRQILEYFRPGDDRGPLGYLQSHGLKPSDDPQKR